MSHEMWKVRAARRSPEPGTPRPVIDRLATGLGHLIGDEEVRQKVAAQSALGVAVCVSDRPLCGDEIRTADFACGCAP
jgi:hypothetical protein